MKRRTILKGMAATIACATALPATQVIDAFAGSGSASTEPVRWFYKCMQTDMAPSIRAGDDLLIEWSNGFQGDGVYLWNDNDEFRVSRVEYLGFARLQVRSGNFRFLKEMSVHEFNELLIGKARYVYRTL